MTDDMADSGTAQPFGDPRIIAELGGVVDETRVWLGLYGELLDPIEISATLGLEPTSAHKRGDARRTAGPWPQGAWILTKEGEPSEQPAEVLRVLLDALPSDPDVWAALRGRFAVRLTFGLHLDAFNRGFDLPPELVGRIASIGAIVGFDIYCDGEVFDGPVE